MYEAIQSRSLKVFRFDEFQMSHEMAKSFYREHKGKKYNNSWVGKIVSSV